MKRLFLLSSVVLTLTAHSQKIETNSLEHLAFIVQDKMNTYDVETKKRQPETFLMFFEVDSSGGIIGIHIMSDEETRDASYLAAKKVKPVDLKEWIGTNYKSKVIIMPVNTFGRVDNRVNGTQVEPPKNYLNRGDIPPLRESAEWKTSKGSSYIIGPNILYHWKFGKIS
jgi:hypothetical protein